MPRQGLALHCSLAHGGAWAGLAAALPGVALTAPDLLGHGRAPDWDGVCDYHAAVTAQVAALAEGLGRPLDIMGHSFGGTVALRLAIERPDLVRSLVLIEPVFFAAAKAARDPAWESFIADHREFGALVAAGERIRAARAFHAIWGGDAGFDSLPARMQAYMVERIHLITAPWSMVLEDAPGLLATGRLEGVACPVLLLQGGQSPEIIGAINRALAARLREVRVETVAGAGHMLPISHVGQVAPLVQKFLSET